MRQFSRPSRKSHACARPSRRQGRSPPVRVERSESLDAGEASAKMRRRDGRPADYLRLEARTAEARFSGWIHATNPRSCAWPWRRGVTEAVLASRFTTCRVPSRNGERRSSRKIGPLASVVNRQGDESSAVPTCNDASFVTTLVGKKANRFRRDGRDACARSVSAASSRACTRFCVSRGAG
jgi:hypothetical protein